MIKLSENRMRKNSEISFGSNISDPALKKKKNSINCMPEVEKCKVRLYEKKNEMPDYFFPHKMLVLPSSIEQQPCRVRGMIYCHTTDLCVSS